MKRIGIFGGTFNPIHTAHIRVADEARKKLKLDKVIFVPAGISPHKNKRDMCLSSARLKMVKLAIANNKYFDVSDIEAKNNRKSYSIETINRFRKKYGSNVKLFFLLGIDAMSEISTWKNPKDIVKLCTFVCLTRPNYSVRKLKLKLIKEGFLLNKDYYYLKVSSLKIASTEIRGRVKLGLNVKNMLPVKVDEYIKRNGLYEGRRNKKKNKKTSCKR